MPRDGLPEPKRENYKPHWSCPEQGDYSAHSVRTVREVDRKTQQEHRNGAECAFIGSALTQHANGSHSVQGFLAANIPVRQITAYRTR
jgi:hypothetical protein